jgi:choline dehydrogenase
MTTEFDYIVVGAGSAGSAVAARLAESRDCSVLLIEAGGWDRALSIRVPGLVIKAIANPALNWMYRGEPDASISGRSITWSSGRVLGGGSSINGMVFGRGLLADFDHWAANGGPGWGWNDVLPVFRRMEHWKGSPNALRGDSGPLIVVPLAEPHDLCRRFVEGASRVIPFVPDYNVGISDGMGYTQASQIRGERCSAARAYLHRRPRGLSIVVNAFVTRLLIQGGRCIGVEYLQNGALRQVNAASSVVLSAGAVATPKLLMLSGIGPADELRTAGVAPVLDLPGVGHNLQEHVGVPIHVRAKLPSYNRELGGWRRAVHGARWIVARSGPASRPANQVQMFVKTDPALPQADAQIQMGPVGFSSRDGAIQIATEDSATFVVSLCHPESRGAVTLRSADPAARPVIAYPMQGSVADLDRIMTVIKNLRDILQTPSLASAFGDFIQPSKVAATRADWHDFIRAASVPHFHLSGTCRMGSDDGAVVDHRLAVRGIGGLAVADVSILPRVTSGNTNATAIMIGERAADFL